MSELQQSRLRGARRMSRRYFLEVTGAGSVVATTLGAGALLPGTAGAAEPFTWISPRGTLEVLDDYAYWAGKAMGYFGDLETRMEAGPSDGTATVKFVALGQADMGYPSPGVFSFAIENGLDLVSGLEHGRRGRFRLRLSTGRGCDRPEGARRQDRAARKRCLAGDLRSDVCCRGG